MPPLCSEGDRILTPLYLRLWVPCPCCVFWRGAVFVGLPAGALIGAAVALLILRFT